MYKEGGEKGREGEGVCIGVQGGRRGRERGGGSMYRCTRREEREGERGGSMYRCTKREERKGESM